MVLAVVSATSALALSLGESAPSATVKMKNLDGSELTIGAVAGSNGTLVIFSCNHCPYVKAWEPRLAAIGNGCKGKGIGVVMINPNDPKAYPEDSFEVMQQRAKERGFAFPYVVDATSDVARAFGATRTPEAFLFDKAGKLVYHGVVDDNAQEPDKVEKHYLQDAVDALAAGKLPPVQETKALGCSIKFRPKA
jgi:thiol-disulfide isomerase/thioredoxin